MRFANGKALGSYAGLCSTPYSSGGTDREQGIKSKAGNRRLRTVMIELAWLWQALPTPGSAEVNWFRARVQRHWRAYAQGDGGGLGPQAAHRVVALRHPGR